MNIRIPSLYFCSLLLSSHAFAQTPAQCIENPQREYTCERTIVKKTDPNYVANGKILTPTICVCVSDFEPLIGGQSDDKTKEQALIWLEDWSLTQQDLLQLLRY